MVSVKGSKLGELVRVLRRINGEVKGIDEEPKSCRCDAFP